MTVYSTAHSFMKLLQLLRKDRRLLLLVLIGLLALALGFFTFNTDTALTLMTGGGYWAILGTAGWFAWAVFQIARTCRPWEHLAKPGAWRILVLLFGCGVLLLVHEKYGFKILMDEVMLLGTSMGMHFDKHPFVPVRAHDLQGAFQLLDGLLDKRPLFHPFLVSLLHDLTGYRPENVFVLNTVLTFVLLGLVYHAARKMAGNEAGIVACLLLTSLPLLAQSATGGGFDLLNLVMIMTALVLAIRYGEQRDLVSQQALLLSSVLLAQTRYESILFLLPVGLLIVWVWWSERRPLLDFGTCFIPLLFLPVALHQKIFSARESAWELASQPGFEQPFSLTYAPDNFLHWLNFFFDTTGENSNSLVLSTFGFLALPFCMLWTVKLLARLRDATPAQVTLAFFSVGFAAHSLLLLCYFWGRFDDPVIRRLSLPLNLWLVLAVVIAVAELFRQQWIWRLLMALTGIGIFAYSLPTMARHDYSLDYYVGREMEWRREFMSAHPEKDYLFIDNDALIWITHQISGTPIRQALNRKGIIQFNFRNHTFAAFYVFQRYDVEPSTGRLVVQKEYDLGPDYQLETYWERRFTPLTISRISRVISIKEGDITVPAKLPSPLEKLTPAQRDKIRQDYFEQLIKRLP